MSLKEKTIIITPFSELSNDERGVTSEFNIPRKQDSYIYLTRKKGSFSGNTYHTGKESATNPKIFLLISGEIKFSYRKIGSNHKDEQIITSPSSIAVYPLITHAVEALTDIIILECNSISDIQNDRTREIV